MAIESKLPTRANPSPAHSSSDATARQARSDHVENRETSTDHANKEIAKPEFDVVQEQARSPQ